MDITNITNFKPDTELHNDNPFQRTEFERVKKARMIGKWSKWFQVVESILEGSDDPEIATKIGNTGGFIVYLLKERVLEIEKKIKIFLRFSNLQKCLKEFLK